VVNKYRQSHPDLDTGVLTGLLTLTALLAIGGLLLAFGDGFGYWRLAFFSYRMTMTEHMRFF
jgi:hypothetical protein